MPNSIASLLATGTKLWLDSIDPDLVRSTSVEERNPEIYDQYCSKETDDEDSNA